MAQPHFQHHNPPTPTHNPHVRPWIMVILNAISKMLPRAFAYESFVISPSGFSRPVVTAASF